MESLISQRLSAYISFTNADMKKVMPTCSCWINVPSHCGQNANPSTWFVFVCIIFFLSVVLLLVRESDTNRWNRGEDSFRFGKEAKYRMAQLTFNIITSVVR